MDREGGQCLWKPRPGRHEGVSHVESASDLAVCGLLVSPTLSLTEFEVECSPTRLTLQRFGQRTAAQQ